MKHLLFLFLSLVFLGCQNPISLLSADNPLFIELSDSEEPKSHPYFDDRNTLKWYNDKSFAAALNSGSHILVEVGRKNCSLCKRFVERILPLYKSKLTNFVGVESNADSMSAEIRALVIKHMRHATLLPVILIINKDGKYIGGIFGDISSQRTAFLKLVENV